MSMLIQPRFPWDQKVHVLHGGHHTHDHSRRGRGPGPDRGSRGGLDDPGDPDGRDGRDDLGSLGGHDRGRGHEDGHGHDAGAGKKRWFRRLQRQVLYHIVSNMS